jgi:N-acetylmuramic acid 6-phosphate etherase
MSDPNWVLSNTESPSKEHPALDTYASTELVAALASDQLRAVQAVQLASGQIAQAVDAALPKILAGGRLVYVGAGTSGRLGLLDSVELAPTFSWPDHRAVALLAGGPSAVYKAIEGAEDDAPQGAADVVAAQVGVNDVVLLVAASGSTPYVYGALDEAKERGALTIAFANNPNSIIAARAHIGITLDTGAELISGSTRLKAGTSQKVALNTFSSALMVKLGKVYGNLMVDVKPTNKKLIRRCINLTMLATDCDEAQAKSALEASQYHVKTAIIMIQRQLSASAAQAFLHQAHDDLRLALSASGALK